MPHYALIDCAVDPALFPMVAREAEYKCLFSGALDPALISAAPYIVRLDQGSDLHKALLGPGWGANWGMIVASQAPLAPVRKALRANLQALLPDHRVMLFRFYDPRVFVPFIEACAGDELDAWFDPVTDYWAPGPEGTLHYQRTDGVLMRRVLPPAPDPAPAPAPAG